MSVELRAAAFDPGAELSAFEAEGAGAVVSFTGIARADEGSTALEIEHYPGMAEAALAEMVAEATERFGLQAARVVHRHGLIGAGEPIMMVLTAARHRRAAFEGAEFLMDWLKSRAPFWKREHRAEGPAWVAARETDEDALGRWSR
jgi:molybdopterin synthase catalytic subunit